MKKLFLLAVLLTFCGSLNAYAVNRDENLVPADGLFLPQGDAGSGRAAFQKLRCNVCHAVYNDESMAPASGVRPGPVLGLLQMDYSIGWLANGIVNPSHTIVTGPSGQAAGSDLSLMGDFTETMTVRQLIDVLAYLKSVSNDLSSTGSEASSRSFQSPPESADI